MPICGARPAAGTESKHRMRHALARAQIASTVSAKKQLAHARRWMADAESITCIDATAAARVRRQSQLYVPPIPLLRNRQLTAQDPQAAVQIYGPSAILQIFSCPQRKLSKAEVSSWTVSFAGRCKKD